jgi:hypothetical protein
MSQEPRNHGNDSNRHQREAQQQHQAHEGEHQAQEHAPQPDAAPPGTRVANPAQPYADTVVPERRDASAFLRAGADTTHPQGYPKLKYHPVHGGITVKDQGEEAALYPVSDWFDSAELADLARTHTEAEAVRTHNQIAKLKELEEKGLPVVRNSVQSDEAIRRAQIEPL